jgi:hypothetical protein
MRSKAKANRSALHANVYSVNSTLEELASSRTGKNKFLGAAIDTGADRSVIVWKQATMYFKSTRSDMDLLPSNRLFKFGDQACRSMGSLRLSVKSVKHVFCTTSLTKSRCPKCYFQRVVKNSQGTENSPPVSFNTRFVSEHLRSLLWYSSPGRGRVRVM